ncbi:MAG: type II/IV secretion system protein [Phycisphaerae bacterium]|nr:type II/IV secretion system protein [Phycisphaerae bacterium]
MNGNGTAVRLDLASIRAAASAPDASLRERCGLLGIEWLEKAPSAEAAAVELVPADVAVRLRVVPLRIVGARLLVAMADPLDLAALDEVAALAGRPLNRAGMEPAAFSELMRSAYGTTAARMAESLAGEAELASTTVEHNLDAIDAADVHRMAEQPTLINLVNLVILEAIQNRASDIHIEPFEAELKIKYRIDGVLVEQKPPPKHLQAALIGRVKIMAHMNIAERYVPQDGHITLRFEGRKVDIRVSTVPTIYGESVVMRILDKSALPLDLRSLGMSEPHRAMMDRLIEKPHGMVLVTGPTGSGKTTTLYAALSKLYDPRKKIITIEDPVEYELAGINQIPVNPKRGLTFATGLRSILRQDPDVIFVGEIRDNETVDIAIRSALTGHLIFSTLHTNDAISSVGRMVDMGAEPYLIASVLEGLLAQRLGRRICRHCAVKVPLDDDRRARITAEEAASFKGHCTIGRGCDECNGSGFRGRLGFFELARINPRLRAGISKGLTVLELRTLVDSDFVTMRGDGIAKAAQGVTTIEEVLRATQDVEDNGG